LHAGKARDVLDLIQKDQSQNLPDARDRVYARKRVDIVRFGPARAREFDLTQQLIVVINERHIDFDRLADTGSGEMLGYVFAI
jgi:hypothetical protein